MFRKLFFVFTASVFLSGCSFSLASLRPNQKSGLQVTSTPQATVFLNGNSLGITPILEEDLKPGTYTIKLTPSDSSIQPWETQITLVPGVLTVVDRKLGTSIDLSHGYNLSFEKLTNSKESRLAITTIPDSVTVTVDGNPQGFTPVSLDSLAEGDHTILLTSPGFEDKTVRARTVTGYSLTIAAQLAKKSTPPILGFDTEATESATPSATPTPSPSAKPTVTPKPSIATTPTPTSTPPVSNIAKPYIEISNSVDGWANIRTEANTASTVINKAYNGERFAYLNTTQNGYYKIQYSPTQLGWVSATYSKLVE